MAENLMALLQYLTSSASPLPRMQEYTPPQTTYFAFLGRYFLMWKFRTAGRLYNTFLGISIVFIVALSPSRRFGLHLASFLSMVGSLFGAIVAVNIVALIMKHVLHKGMTWFAVEWYALALYGAPALLGTSVDVST